MHWILLLFAWLAGAIVTVQAAINTQLRVHLEHPLLAALASFTTGTVLLIIVCLIGRVPLPGSSKFLQAPWWIWMGGVIGVCFVTGTVMLAPRLGTAVYFALVVTGQMSVALVLDHYGWFGFPVQPINVWRMTGVVLLVAGVALIQRN